MTAIPSFDKNTSAATPRKLRFRTFRHKNVMKELSTWGKISILSTLQACTELTPWIVSLAFVGSVSSTQLAALSLVEVWVYSFLEISWLAVTQAASVLISQAHGASSLSAKHGWFVISLIIMTIASTIVSLASICSVYALNTMTSDAELVREGSYYASSITPAIFFASYEQLISTYLISTGHAGYSSVCAFLFCFFDIALTYLFMFGGLGIKPYDNALTANAMSWNVSSFLGFSISALILWRVLLNETNEDGYETGSNYSDISLNDEERGSRLSPAIELTKQQHHKLSAVETRVAMKFEENRPSSAIQQIKSEEEVRSSSKGNNSISPSKRSQSDKQNNNNSSNWLIFPGSNSGKKHESTEKRLSLTGSGRLTADKKKLTAKRLFGEYDSISSSDEEEHPKRQDYEHNSYQTGEPLRTQIDDSSKRLLEKVEDEIIKPMPSIISLNTTKHLRLSLDGSAKSTLTLEALGLVAEVSEVSIQEWVTNKQAWFVFVQLLLPFVATAAMESMIFFALAFLAAQLGRPQIAAHNTCSAIIEYTFGLIVGMAEATSVRVGYYVGKGSLSGSLTVSVIAIVNSLILGILFAVLCSTYSREIAYIFTEDEEIIAYILQVSPLVWASFAIFSVGDQMLAILEGQGRGSMQMLATFVGQWMVTLPLACWLFYVEQGGLRDLWLALLIGYVVSEVIALYAVWISDWESIFEHAKEHMTLD